MNRHIAYLLGAGSSHGVVPMVSEFTGAAHKYLSEGSVRFKSLGDPQSILGDFMKPKDYWEQFKRKADELIREADKRHSLDVFARQLYNQRRWDDLKHLKALISGVILWQQGINGIAKRVDHFVTLMYQLQERVLAGHLTLISWNYDTQLELALARCAGTSYKSALQSILDWDDQDQIRGAHLYRLNGCIGAWGRGHELVSFDDFYGIEERELLWDRLLEITVFLTDVKGPDNPSTITFAWEEINKFRELRQRVAKRVRDAEALVIIGYSFPEFNREVDEHLLQSMKKLRKVYIQDPVAERIEHRFNEIKGEMELDIQYVPYDDNFWVPRNF